MVAKNPFSSNAEANKKKAVEPAQVNMEENVDFYELDDDDSNWDAALTDEQANEIQVTNDKYIRDEIQPMLLGYCQPCQCQMEQLVHKAQRRAALLNLNPRDTGGRLPIVLEQEDIDKYHFGILVESHQGVYKGINTVVRECTACHQITYWGRAAVFTRLLAEFTTGFMNTPMPTLDAVKEDEQPNVDGIIEIPEGASMDLTDPTNVEKIFGEGAYLEQLPDEGSERTMEEILEEEESNHVANDTEPDPGEAE